MGSSMADKYQLLQGTESEDGVYQSVLPYQPSRKQRLGIWGLIIALAVSVLSNAALLYQQIRIQPSEFAINSRYAQLSRKLFLPFVVEGHENTTPDEEWEWPSIDPGVVALTNDYVSSMNLPTAQRYPWDSNKGIYILHGHHNLHCIKNLRKSILEYRASIPQSEHPLHVDHCLTALREDILCNADDTPRYTGGHHKQPGSGQGQVRECRDWKELEAWAVQHTACYQHPKNWLDGRPRRERYMHCPDGSEPWADGVDVGNGTKEVVH